MSNLNTWLSYIENIHNKIIDMELNRISSVAMHLDLLKPKSFIFTVAGTNGKGTTCRILELVLISAGYKVGVYSSPHLICYTERIRVQNSALPHCLHIDSFKKINYARGNIPLTYFEYSTLSALYLFKKLKLDIIILEVGLGGRLDATNIIDSDISIITNVALDHTEWLGSDRESIAIEKAGIFRAGKPAIIGDLNIPKNIISIAKKKNVKLFCRNIDWYFITTPNSFIYGDNYGQLQNLPIPFLPESNVATAIAALRNSKLKFSISNIITGIKKAKLPGRFHIIGKSPYIILDVAHNPHAAEYLVNRVKLIPKYKKILAIIGIMRDKNISGILYHMQKIVDKWYFVSLNTKRGATAKQLIEYINKGKAYENIIQAWRDAISDASSNDIVLVCGSFYTVASVMKILDIKIN